MKLHILECGKIPIKFIRQLANIIPLQYPNFTFASLSGDLAQRAVTFYIGMLVKSKVK